MNLLAVDDERRRKTDGITAGGADEQAALARRRLNRLRLEGRADGQADEQPESTRRIEDVRVPPRKLAQRVE